MVNQVNHFTYNVVLDIGDLTSHLLFDPITERDNIRECGAELNVIDFSILNTQKKKIETVVDYLSKANEFWFFLWVPSEEIVEKPLTEVIEKTIGERLLDLLIAMTVISYRKKSENHKIELIGIVIGNDPEVSLCINNKLPFEYRKTIDWLNTDDREDLLEVLKDNVLQWEKSKNTNNGSPASSGSSNIANENVITHENSIFYSYSHKDEEFREELEAHLTVLKRKGVISTWYDRKILPGEEWDKVINYNLEKATIILLLISADFIASNYCWEKEVKLALKRHELEEAVVVPVLLRPCDLKGTPFEKINGLPKDMLAITSWSNRDSAWEDVTAGIRKIVENSKK